MKFKIALEAVHHEIFEVEAESAEIIRKHWAEHELRKVPDCDCNLLLRNLLQTELVKWKILDLHPIKDD